VVCFENEDILLHARRRIPQGDTETPGLLENNLTIPTALFTYFTLLQTGSLTMRTALRSVTANRRQIDSTNTLAYRAEAID